MRRAVGICRLGSAWGLLGRESGSEGGVAVREVATLERPLGERFRTRTERTVGDAGIESDGTLIGGEGVRLLGRTDAGASFVSTSSLCCKPRSALIRRAEWRRFGVSFEGLGSDETGLPGQTDSLSFLASVDFSAVTELAEIRGISDSSTEDGAWDVVGFGNTVFETCGWLAGTHDSLS